MSAKALELEAMVHHEYNTMGACSNRVGVFVPLSVLNYTWKVQCKMALMKEGVWRIVDGTETAPRAG